MFFRDILYIFQMGIFQSKECEKQIGGRRRYKDYDISQYLKNHSDFSEFEQMKNELIKQFGGADKNIEDADFDDFIQALQNSTEINIQTGGKKSSSSSSTSSVSSMNLSNNEKTSSSSSSESSTSEISDINMTSLESNKKITEEGLHPEKYSPYPKYNHTDINVMPFYTSSESPNQHPYIRRRFKN